MDIYKPRPKEIATEYLEAYILEHNLKAHDRLPTEREMSDMWHLNRITLRSAIASMEAAGRLYSVHGRGFRIWRVLPNMPPDMMLYRKQGCCPSQRSNATSTLHKDSAGCWGTSSTVLPVSVSSEMFLL